MIRITACFPAAPSQRSPSLGGRQAELSQSQVRDLGCIILSTVIRRLTEILTITSKAPSCPNAQRSTREDFQHGRLLDSWVVLFILIVRYECVEQVCTSGGDESCSVLFLSFTVKGGVFVPPRVVANSVSESALVGIESVRMVKESEQIGG